MQRARDGPIGQTLMHGSIESSRGKCDRLANRWIVQSVRKFNKFPGGSLIHRNGAVNDCDRELCDRLANRQVGDECRPVHCPERLSDGAVVCSPPVTPPSIL
jgi:hypothetical protein